MSESNQNNPINEKNILNKFPMKKERKRK